ncbi:MAG: hypothetical protein ABI697_03110 [Devosia sp.]
MAITLQGLIRASGLVAIAGGIIFAGIQPIHPADEVASVTTTLWAVIISLKFIMCLFFLVGFAGIYARQAEKAGWLGLAGFTLMTISFWLQTGFVFFELFVLPVVATAMPGFVESALGVANGHPGALDIGAFIPAYGVLGVCYLLGGVLFGIATVRAAVLPRGPAILLVVAAVITPAAALLPHALQRYAAVPMGIAMIWLGYSLWSEHRRGTAERSSPNAAPSPATAA